MRFASVLHEGSADGRARRRRSGRAAARDRRAGVEHAALAAARPAARVATRRSRSRTSAAAPWCPDPGKVICVGLNYAAHIEETKREHSDYPVLFTKFATTLTGPFDPIPLPPESEAIDYEGELVVVIGERGRRIPREQALEHVAGYSIANDVSMRDYQYKTHQWLQGKAWDASTPVGPDLVTLDEITEPLTLRTFVNGEKVQEASTELLIFDVATLVSTVSEFATVEPGDLILTGTPGGVGYRREPQLLLERRRHRRDRDRPGRADREPLRGLAGHQRVVHRRREAVDIVLGGVPRAHPAHLAGGLVPDVERVVALQ